MNVLLVDDDEIFRNRLSQILRQRGITVVEASNVPSALSKLSGYDYQAALVDLNMPGSNGLSLLPILKDKYPNAKVVVLTGYGSVTTASQAFKLGAVDYLPKPASISEILEAIGVVPSKQKKIQPIYPSLDEVERDYLNRVLTDCDGNISKAAKLLGLHRRSLQRKLARE